jgi:hypothetical protein
LARLARLSVAAGKKQIPLREGQKEKQDGNSRKKSESDRW